MTAETKQIIDAIEDEYMTYKCEWWGKTAGEVWENSIRITAWRCIKDYLTDDELTDEEYEKLYQKANGKIVSGLVDWYMDSESYDIGVYSEIRELVFNYLEFCE